MTRVIRMRRGPIAAAFEILFYLFNALMLLALIAVKSGATQAVTAAAERGAATSGLAGLAEFAATVVVLHVWMAGAVILAALVLVSRRRQITIEEKPD